MPDFVARFLADPTVSTIITAAAAGLIALWLLAAMWAHGDADRRTGSSVAALIAAGWVLLSTPPMLPLSLAIYALIRPSEPLAERRAREITAAMVAETLAADACQGCGSIVDGSWRRCPTCASWLAAPCAGCGRWSDVELASCPWCADSRREPPTVDGAIHSGGVATLRLPGDSMPALAPALPTPSTAARARGTVGREASAGPRRQWSSSRWQRRAPGAARSPERGKAGGRSGAPSRA